MKLAMGLLLLIGGGLLLAWRGVRNQRDEHEADETIRRRDAW